MDTLRSKRFCSALVRKDSTNQKNLHVQYQIHPGNTYRFGNIRIRLANEEPPDLYTEQQLTYFPSIENDSLSLKFAKRGI